jgi:hypothetical protein
MLSRGAEVEGQAADNLAVPTELIALRPGIIHGTKARLQRLVEGAVGDQPEDNPLDHPAEGESAVHAGLPF